VRGYASLGDFPAALHIVKFIFYGLFHLAPELNFACEIVVNVWIAASVVVEPLTLFARDFPSGDGFETSSAGAMWRSAGFKRPLTTRFSFGNALI